MVRLLASPRLLSFIFPIIAPCAWKNGAGIVPLHAEGRNLDLNRVPVSAFQSSYPHHRACLNHFNHQYREEGVLCRKDRRSPCRQLASTSSEGKDNKDVETENAIRIISTVMGERGSAAFDARRELATAQQEGLVKQGMAKRQLVYGELQLDRFIMLMEAAGVRDMAKTRHRKINFLDIGSGDGQLVFAAALVYPELLELCRGVEVVDGLAGRSQEFERGVRELAAAQNVVMATCELLHCDIYDGSGPAKRIVSTTDLAVCFATTWDHDSQRKGYVPGLSQTLAGDMCKGSKVLMVDKKLCEEDGWYWEGSLDFANADVAPYSTAHLYLRQ